MSFGYLHNEVAAERLLLVQIEAQQTYNSQHRHIAATVVRRAADHTYRPDGSVLFYQDGPNSVGYRNCSWSKSTTGAIYTANMKLRGQIDTDSNPLNEGQPYGNEVTFDPYEVDMKTAKSIYDTYSKWARFCEKQPRNYNSRDSFEHNLILLSQFLKISKFVFFQSPCNSQLDNLSNLEELSCTDAIIKISKILQPFYQPKQK